ncbi:MAG: glycosyl transferase, partial [Prolixibacteraceae bacterium]|nr:glycosyl transferase [Prolixibacteraceae bacterium]
MKKVLIITYYWPPCGGSGVRRWLNFSNHFHEHGWEPVIFKPQNANYPSFDETLTKTIHPETEVIGCKIIEPFKIYSKFIGSK